MSVETARAHLARFGLDDRILLFEVSSATVALAAEAVGCAPSHIAKTLAFSDKDGGCLLVVAAGNAKIDNGKFKAIFGQKARMLSPIDTERLVGHAVGGVCPFGVNPGVKVFTDRSLQCFDTVYPAVGSGNSAIPLSCGELFEVSGSLGWVDVCKDGTSE